MLCVGAAGTMMAQKAVVDQAAKLSGKADKIAESRSLIDQASKNPETANDARTYYVGGKNEYEVYDLARTMQMINPQDKDVKPIEMGKQLLNGYKMFQKALPLDSVPDAKGKIKPKYSKDMISRINGHFNDYFNSAIAFYNEKMYYPEAYESFMLYGDLPKSVHADKLMKATADSVINTAYFNAGIAAYAGNALPEAALAFKKARQNNYDIAQNYVYEIACWQYMAQNDSTKADEAQKQIEDIALDGYKKFGTSQMLFINNLVNSWMNENKTDKVLALLNEEIGKNPENGALYGLRGFVYDRNGKDDESVADYRKAASFADTDFETLKNASKKIFRTGTTKWNAIEGAAPEARQDVKVNYFEAAKAIADRAKSMNPDDSDVNYVLENINYALDTYFNK